MTQATQKIPATSASPKLITGLVLAMGLLLMFAVSIKERLINPTLMKDNRPTQASNSISGGGDDMSAMVGQLMQDIQKNPQDVDKLLLLAQTLLEQDRLDAASNFIHRTLELAPTNDEAHYLHAVILTKTDKHMEAAKAFEQVVALKDRGSARYNLGILYIHYLNNPEKGMEHLQKGLEVPDASESLKDAMRAELAKLQGNDESRALEE